MADGRVESWSRALAFGDLSVYVALFASSFLAATILPLSSEAVLAGLLATRAGEVAPLIITAAVGNTLGSVVNWWLGRAIDHFRDRPWFPVSPTALDRAGARFRRFGLWSLLFAWLPVVGDPLTVVAGILRVPFLPFVVLVGLGKTARYALIAAGVLHLTG